MTTLLDLVNELVEVKLTAEDLGSVLRQHYTPTQAMDMGSERLAEGVAVFWNWGHREAA
jgi:hypothetical protein